MDLLVRYSEISKKQGKTRSRLKQTLRQRIQDRLEFEDIDFEKVELRPGRIIVRKTQAPASVISEVPGVKSCSLCRRTSPKLDKVKRAFELDFQGSFGVRVKSRTSNVSSKEWERKIGGFIQDETSAKVDLDHPDIWFKAEITKDEAFVYTDRFSYEGPGGFPVASQGDYIALVSGGIDSPVAAYQMMRRGADIFPLYFYNKPYALEDHLERFQSVLKELKKFHPSKKWRYGVVDMEKINQDLSEIEHGRLVVHRRIMFKISERIRNERGDKGIVTGESLGQKSSQTSQNMYAASRDIPVFRPLLTEDKNDIQEKAMEIGTFKYSKIDSACPNISPESPATNLSIQELNRLKKEINFDKFVKEAVDSFEEREL